MFCARLIVILFVAVIVGCAPANPRCSSETMRFLRAFEGGDVGDFRERDISNQYEVYICAYEMRPAFSEFDYPFAEGGEPVARYLAERLSDNPTEYDTERIVWVLLLMERERHYRVSQDRELVQLVNARAREISNQFRRQQVEGWAARIASGEARAGGD
jgi:hypothetical protein